MSEQLELFPEHERNSRMPTHLVAGSDDDGNPSFVLIDADANTDQFDKARRIAPHVHTWGHSEVIDSTGAIPDRAKNKLFLGEANLSKAVPKWRELRETDRIRREAIARESMWALAKAGKL
jgi:hypothetical protein